MRIPPADVSEKISPSSKLRLSSVEKKAKALGLGF